MGARSPKGGRLPPPYPPPTLRPRLGCRSPAGPTMPSQCPRRSPACVQQGQAEQYRRRTGVPRTFLHADGRAKAPVSNAKMMLGPVRRCLGMMIFPMVMPSGGERVFIYIGPIRRTRFREGEVSGRGEESVNSHLSRAPLPPRGATVPPFDQHEFSRLLRLLYSREPSPNFLAQFRGTPIYGTPFSGNNLRWMWV